MRPLTLMEYLLLRLVADTLQTGEEELYQEYQEQRPKTRTGTEIREKDVDEIYNAYPTSDPINGNRSTGKSLKDRGRIRALLSKYPKKYILDAINNEIEENKKGKWFRNFSTFLNNLPDIPSVGEEKPKTKYQK